ncbi:MAG TPA: AraC family transcriptional regulator [Armatimonadota bacterium]|jgi:AraC-like DNA-binding protein
MAGNRDNKLAELLRPFVIMDKPTESEVKGVRIFGSETSIPRRPLIYEPSILIIASGRKIVHLGDEKYVYDANNYLVLSVPLPLECETVATPEEPVLGVAISVDAATVSELLLDMDDSTMLSGSVPRGVYATPLTDEMVDATARLLKTLSNPLDARILGPQIVREIIYHVLRGEQGGALRSLANRNSRFSQIAKILKRMHSDFGADIDISTLADEANMSVSSFHSNFKAVTGASPLQYLKSIRLHKARALMAQDGLSVGTSAGKVGYESVSQFSREFKRFFGYTPTYIAAAQTVVQLPSLGDI